MSTLQRFADDRLAPRTSRYLARLADTNDVAVAHVTVTANIETARLDALQQVAGRAMQGVALISQLEQQLTQVVPIAAGRLQAIGDMHALATAEVVAETPRRLR